VAELEARYAAASAPVAAPAGLFVGETLRRLTTPGARRAAVRALQIPLFSWLPWGIDFDARRWFFVRPALTIGRFDATVGPSRWRDTDAIRLTYHGSRLPAPARRLLYDELKPLGPDLALGLGGTNAERDAGDHFFFLLTRAR
jgi:hypothetical protein